MQDIIVKNLVEQLGLKKEEITMDSRFVEDFEMDSLDMVEMLIDLEKETGIKIPNEDAKDLTTVGKLIAYLEEKRMLNGSICELLGIDYPVIQGGMAWVSDAGLAAAVSKAGGLGVIAGNAPPEWVSEQIDLVREQTDKPFGLNVMLLSPNAKDVAELACTKRVPVVTTGAGDPSQYIARWKNAGCLVAPVVASRALAVMLQKRGVDFIIAEGSEAGGHIGELTTMVLVPNVVRSVKLPVVAAGGICDAQTVAAAFCLGAKGVQVGTRFLLAKECAVHEEYKARVIKARDIDSKVTGRVTGHPVRILRSPLARKLAQIEYEEDAVKKLEMLGEGSLQRAVQCGDKESGSFMAGQCACLIDRIQPAAEIIAELFDETCLREICGRVFKD